MPKQRPRGPRRDAEPSPQALEISTADQELTEEKRFHPECKHTEGPSRRVRRVKRRSLRQLVVQRGPQASLPVNQCSPLQACPQLPRAEAAFQRQMCTAANDCPLPLHSPLAHPRSASLQNIPGIARPRTMASAPAAPQSDISTPEQLSQLRNSCSLLPSSFPAKSALRTGTQGLLKSTSDPSIICPRNTNLLLLSTLQNSLHQVC